MWRDFQQGWRYVCKGIMAFYADRTLWKYAILPLLILICLYGSLLSGVIMWLCCSEFSWWKLLLAIGAVVAALLSVYALYELCGAPFFDRMIEKFEQKKFSYEVQPHSVGFNIKFCLQSCHYCVNTILLTVIMSLVGVLVPIIGPVIAAMVVGYRIAVTYLSASGFNYELDLNRTKFLLSKRKMVLFGFGVCCYLLFLLPFAALFTVPGILLGGSLLWHGENMLPFTDAASESPERQLPE